MYFEEHSESLIQFFWKGYSQVEEVMHYTNDYLHAYTPLQIIVGALIAFTGLKFFFQALMKFSRYRINLLDNLKADLFHLAVKTPYGKRYVKNEEEKLRQ